MAVVIAVNQPGIPYRSYAWGDRFTTDAATATRFPDAREAVRRANEISTLTHLDIDFSFLPPRD